MVRPLASLMLDSLILHQVPRAYRTAPESAPPLIYSQVAVDLGPEQRLYIQERIRKSLDPSKLAREVQEDPANGSPIPNLLRHLLEHPQAPFVDASHQMADHLRAVQDGGSPNGLFFFGRCHWGGEPSVLLAKVELERGVQVEQTTDAKGLATYDMTLLQNLVFGQTSRIYKVGLFSAQDLLADSNLLRGLAIDEQMGGARVTKRFLFEYLGCEYLADSAELTRRFYEAAKQHFSVAVADPAQKAQYLIALASELASNRPDLDPSKFAQDHLRVDDQQPFLQRLGDAAVPPGRFRKSTEYVPTQLVRYETDTDVIIIADRRRAEDGVIEVREDSIQVHGRINKVGTQGRMGRPGSGGATDTSQDGS